MMELIENIWEKGNGQISEDKTLSRSFILQSITETSNGITAKLRKVIWLGLIISPLAAIVLAYNFFFYLINMPITVSIVLLFILCCFIFAFVSKQLRVLKNMDTKDLDLQNLLIYKIRYFNTRYQLALHANALAIVLATFSINLTMENSDGIFEIHKILILSAFYLFVYFGLTFLYRVMNLVYLKQLNNALSNLTESKFKSFEKEMKKHKRVQRIIGIIAALIFISGLAVLVFVSYQ